MWNPRGKAETAGVGQAQEQCSRSAGVSEVKYHRAGQEGAPGRWEGVQGSRQAEGSQHTGIAEIVSCEASFISQLFLNSERDEPERKCQVGGCRRPRVSRRLTRPAPVAQPQCGHALAFSCDLQDSSSRPPVNPSFHLFWISTGQGTGDGTGGKQLLSLSPGSHSPGSLTS